MFECVYPVVLNNITYGDFMHITFIFCPTTSYKYKKIVFSDTTAIYDSTSH